MSKSERIRGLAVDIDTRLLTTWLVALEGGHLEEALENDPLLRDIVGGTIRAAYARGYIDALHEDRAGRRAELHRTHGYKPE